MVPLFNNVWERSTAKNYRPVRFVSAASKIFEKLVNNGLFALHEKYGLLSDFQYGLRSSPLTADLTGVSDRIASAFNRSGATPTVTLDIFEAFDRR